MHNKRQKDLIDFRVEKPLGITVAILIAAILCGGIAYKGWQNYQKNALFTNINKYIEIHDTASGEGWLINWVDNADNETGFVVERKQGDTGEFSVIASVEADDTSYIDSDFATSDTYCYKIGAFNSIGTSYSDEACVDIELYEDDIDINVGDDEADSSTSDLGSAVIVSEFIDSPAPIELEGREFYSFKSDITYNSEYSADSVSDIIYDINEGNIYYEDSSLFAVTDQDTEIDNGFVKMNFNTSNNMAFTLNGNGEEQVASIYLSVGVWTSESTSLLVAAGESSETISLPKGYKWFYLKVDVTFDTLAQVSITPLGSFEGYSKVKVAGVLFNNATSEDGASESSFVTLTDISLSESRKIDVTDVKYITSEFVVGNNDLSSGNVESINYEGDATFYSRIYEFQDNGSTVAKGYTAIDWDENSAVTVNLESEDDEFVTASLYLKASAWNDEGGTINVLLNDEVYSIELTSGRKWYYIRVDFEFSGQVNVELRPVDTIGSYSKVMFAGVTIQ